MRFYGLTDEDIALPDQPDFVLSVEQPVCILSVDDDVIAYAFQLHHPLLVLLDYYL